MILLRCIESVCLSVFVGTLHREGKGKSNLLFNYLKNDTKTHNLTKQISIMILPHCTEEKMCVCNIPD